MKIFVSSTTVFFKYTPVFFSVIKWYFYHYIQGYITVAFKKLSSSCIFFQKKIYKNYTVIFEFRVSAPAFKVIFEMDLNYFRIEQVQN